MYALPLVNILIQFTRALDQIIPVKLSIIAFQNFILSSFRVVYTTVHTPMPILILSTVHYYIAR